MRHISEVLDKLFDGIDLVLTNSANGGSGEPPFFMGVATGFTDLDGLTAGFQRSDLIVLAGGPQIGKTSLALGIAYGAAVNHKRTVGVFSLDLSAVDIQRRLIALESGVDTHRLRLGQIDDNEWDRISRAFGRLSESPIFIDDSAAASIMDIRSNALHLQAAHGVDMVIIDYLQLMSMTHGEDRREKFSYVSRELKKLARELNVPVVVLAQIPQPAYGRAASKPKLSDLKDAGTIDEEADLVLFVHREARYDVTSPAMGVAEIIVAKHRNGPKGSINLGFFDRTARFADLELYPGPGM